MKAQERDLNPPESIWKYRFGVPEERTPMSLFERSCQSADPPLPLVQAPTVKKDEIVFRQTARGCSLRLPVADGEHFFGMGLQFKSVEQTGKKKTLRVNSDPVSDAGDSHAPVPFFLSTAGYGILVDTLRYAAFYFGTHAVTDGTATEAAEEPNARLAADSSKSLYAAEAATGLRNVTIDIPAAKGVDLYVFGGPDMATALCRYNMFSGGGYLPPMWGLGIWYRVCAGTQSESEVLDKARYFRDNHIPCDVVGLEPGWQTRCYPCTFVWDREKFPRPETLAGELAGRGFRLNLWEHVFTHAESPLHDNMLPHSGDYKVFGGIVPDLATSAASGIFREHHKTEFIDKGISGFKFDECDNSDFITSPWSFPEASLFPSGMDGEQMHSALGLLYQRMVFDIFLQSNRRTLSAARSSHALAAPLPFVLYSDLYDHNDYIRGMVNMGYSGLMWTPEVRHARSEDELIRRIQSAVMSPMTLFNAWTLPHPPWLQYIREKNRAGELLEEAPELTKRVRDILNFRMTLLPYLYEAYYRYEKTGMPPFRGLPLDFTDDPEVYGIEDSYMVGDSLLFAPVFAGQAERRVYLPGGAWFDFFSGERFEKGYHVFAPDPDDMLLFVRDNSLIPLAAPTEHADPRSVYKITLKKYGSGDAACRLVEDDFTSFDYRNGNMNIWEIEQKAGEPPSIRKTGNYSGPRYEIVP